MTRSTLLRGGLIGLAIAGGLAVGFFGFRTVLDDTATERTGGAGSDAGRATLVSVTQPRTRRLEDSFETVGTVRARRSVAISPEVQGRVARAPLTSGARAEQGALLFALEDAAQRAELAQAEARLAEAESEYRRREQLGGQDVASEAAVETARAAFRRAEAAVSLADEALADRRVTAPFGGRLGLVDLDTGEIVGPGTVVTTLQDLSSVRVDFEVPGRYFNRVATGQRVRLDGEATGETTFTGEVSAISPRISEDTRSVPVRADVPNEERRLAGGMFMDVTLIFDTYEALTVPDDAIISEGETTYVFTVADGTARRREVALGGRTDGAVAVTEGIEGSARVVTSGYTDLSDGDPVRLKSAQGERGTRS